MTSKVLIFGTASFAQVVHFLLKNDSSHEVVGFTVNEDHITKKEIMGLPVLPFEDLQRTHPPDDFKMFVAVGYKRVSLATLWNILGLEDIKDNPGRVVQQAPLELWANLKQRALDVALKEINKESEDWSWNSPGGEVIGRY